ncbi:MCP four helix bundle domain-containing protein, partial [Actinotalea sp.]|uniref:MCP four helix bundle domain-containing protein n=1 Tax=Actinotalea sp. TaxID=1872145 RepID=UPI002BA2061D
MSTLTPQPARRHLVRSLSVRTKILGIVALFAVAGIISGLVAIAGMQGLAENTAELARIQAEVSGPEQTVHQNQLKARMIIAQIAAAPDDESKAMWVAEQVENDAELEAAAAAFEANAGALADGSWLDFRAKWAEWVQVRDEQLMPAALAGDAEEFEQLLLEVAEPVKGEFVDALNREVKAGRIK